MYTYIYLFQSVCVLCLIVATALDTPQVFKSLCACVFLALGVDAISVTVDHGFAQTVIFFCH